MDTRRWRAVSWIYLYGREYREAADRYQHSTAKQAAKIAKKAGVKQLIIGHFSARIIDQTLFLKEAQTEFENTILGKDKTTYEL